MLTKRKQANLNEYIENNTQNCNISYRGGSIKVDLTELFCDRSLEAIEEAGEVPEAGAYQNYLGGGIAGSITAGQNFDENLLSKGDLKKFEEFKEAVKVYFYDVNNGGGDEYMQENVNNYKQNQRLPVRGY